MASWTSRAGDRGGLGPQRVDEQDAEEHDCEPGEEGPEPRGAASAARGGGAGSDEGGGPSGGSGRTVMRRGSEHARGRAASW